MKRLLQMLVIVASLHIVGICLYFATMSVSEHASKYGSQFGEGFLSWLIFPLFGIIGPSHLSGVEALPLVAGLFIANSILWAFLVLVIARASRMLVLSYRAPRPDKR